MGLHRASTDRLTGLLVRGREKMASRGNSSDLVITVSHFRWRCSTSITSEKSTRADADLYQAQQGGGNQVR